jgi:hypothetical protein
VTPSGPEHPSTAPSAPVGADAIAPHPGSPPETPILAASPAPRRGGPPLVPIFLVGGVALIVGILAFGRSSGNDELPPDPSPTSSQVPASSPPPSADTAAEGAPPAQGHASRWEQTAEALGAIEKHLNRAQLVFEELDRIPERASRDGADASGGTRRLADLVGPAGLSRGERRYGQEAPDWVKQRRPPPPPSGDFGNPPEFGGGPPPPDGAPPRGPGSDPGKASNTPPGAGGIDTQTASRAVWEVWKQDWSRDLDVAESLLVPNDSVDAQLRPGHDAVQALLRECRALPPGEPADKSSRSAWLASLKDRAATTRETLYESR